MISPKKKPPTSGVSIERLLILVTALGLMSYVVIVGISTGKIDFVYALGALALIVGYFAKELTGQKSSKDDEENQS